MIDTDSQRVADVRAQFNSSMVIVRHTVETCIDRPLAADFWRELNKQVDKLQKKFGFTREPK